MNVATPTQPSTIPAVASPAPRSPLPRTCLRAMYPKIRAKILPIQKIQRMPSTSDVTANALVRKHPHDRGASLGQVGDERLEFTIGPRGPGLLDALVVLGEVQATGGVRGPQLLGDPLSIDVRGPHPASRILVVHNANDRSASARLVPFIRDGMVS